MIINTLLIILYNINNYLYIICSNKRYTTSKIEAYSRIKNEKLFFNKKPIMYRLSKVKLYCFIILQNIVLFQPLVNYIPTSSKNYYRIIITLIMLVVFLFLVINQLSEYNYKNIINYMINILILFCFYSIILDNLLNILKYRLKNIFFETTNIIEKLF